jgi:lysophospholipase L1-like esterase
LSYTEASVQAIGVDRTNQAHNLPSKESELISAQQVRRQGRSIWTWLLAASAALGTTSEAGQDLRQYQPAFHQALRWSTATHGRSTFRMKIPVGAAGPKLRVSFRAGDGPLALYSATVALAGTHGATLSVPVPLRFQSQPTFSASARQRFTSDELSFPVELGTEVYVSFEVDGAVAQSAIMAFPDSYRWAGSYANLTAPPAGTPWPQAVGVDTIDVLTPPTRAFVAIGDSITEGYVDGDVDIYRGRSDDYRNAWTTLAQRHLKAPIANAAVSLQGVDAAISHLSTDVLTLRGITDCIVLIGTNDLAVSMALEIESRLQLLFDQLAPFCKVWAATLLPREQASRGHLETVNARRQQVNDWIRHSARIAGVLDFESALADPLDPNRFREGLTSDGLHQSIDGNRVLGDLVAARFSGSQLGPAPVVSRITPSEGPANKRFEAVIVGSNFHPNATVDIDQTQATVVGASDAHLVIQIPPHPPGPADLTVSNPDGQSVHLAAALVFNAPSAPPAQAGSLGCSAAMGSGSGWLTCACVATFLVLLARRSKMRLFSPSFRNGSRLAIHTTILCSLSLALAQRAYAFDDVAAARVLTFAGQQLANTAQQLPPTLSPKAARSDGSWTTVSNTDAVGWTQGFFPGAMWLKFDELVDPDWRSRADTWTRPLEGQKYNRQTHDLGFKLMTSFGQAYRLTGDPYYRDVLLVAAESLASRFNPLVGIIKCCDWNPDWQLPLVIDTMMNLELLLWAADNGGQPEWRSMAVSHALKTINDAVRSNGSTYHVVDYNPSSGAIRFQGTFQGYADWSTWSRGQAWAIYGFTVVYRFTGDARMLEAARLTADYYLSLLPADMVPNWDFDAPSQQKDTSAAAAVASALFELAQLIGPVDGGPYRDAALRMLDALSAAPYFAEGSNAPGLLLHAVGHYPAGHEVDTTLIYGDYYFQEAVMRYRSMPASADGGLARRDGGSSRGDGGMLPSSDAGLSGRDGGSPVAGPQDTNALGGPPPVHAGCQQGGLAGFTFLGLLTVASALRPARWRARMRP